MRLKNEKPKRKKLGNLTVVADKVNIVTPGGKPLQVSGTGLGGVRAPKRQYQFSFDQAPSTSVTGKEDVLQPPTIPLPQQPQASAVTNSLGRIGRLLGEMALNYAGQALFNQAGTATENWMYNTESSANVPEVPDSLIPPTIGQTLNQGGNAAWVSTQPAGIGGSPVDITYSNPTTWTGTFPSSTPVTPTPPVFSPNLPLSPINTNVNRVVGPDSAGLTPTAATTPYSAGLTPSTPTSAMVTPPYSGPNLAQRVPGGWPDAMSPDGQTPIPRPPMTEINLATPRIETIPTQEAVPVVYEPVYLCTNNY